MIRRLLLLGFLASAIPASADSFSVAIDTSLISGMTGSLFISYGPGISPFDPATATVAGFTGGTLGLVLLPGGAGVLPANLALDNSAPVLYQQAFTYGSQTRFTLSFTGPAISSPNPGAVGGTDFALFLLDGSDAPLLTDDPNGSIFDASIEAGTGQVSFATFTNDSNPSVVTVTSTPEPGSLLLLFSGLAGLGLQSQRGRKDVVSKSVRRA